MAMLVEAVAAVAAEAVAAERSMSDCSVSRQTRCAGFCLASPMEAAVLKSELLCCSVECPQCQSNEQLQPTERRWRAICCR